MLIRYFYTQFAEVTRQVCAAPGPEKGYLFIVKSSIVSLLVSATLSSTVIAQNLSSPQDLEQIRNITSQFLKLELKIRGQSGNVKIGKLDSHLLLDKCSKNPEAFLPGNKLEIGNLSVGVRCKGVKTWTIYVPARVGIFGKVVVTSHALPQGRVISAGDIKLVTRDLANLSGGYILSPRRAIGRPLRQPLSIGAVITPASIRLTGMVQRGDKITILAHRKGAEVRIKGTAMANGAAGDRIKVRNSLSNKISEGIINKYGEIRLEF